MKNVAVELTIDENQQTVNVMAPAGTSFGGFKFTLSDGSAPQVVTAAPWRAVFSVNPGAISATGQAVDQNGVAFGPMFTSDTKTIEDDVSVAIPNVTTISLAIQ